MLLVKNAWGAGNIFSSQDCTKRYCVALTFQCILFMQRKYSNPIYTILILGECGGVFYTISNNKLIPPETVQNVMHTGCCRDKSRYQKLTAVTCLTNWTAVLWLSPGPSRKRTGPLALRVRVFPSRWASVTLCPNLDWCTDLKLTNNLMPEQSERDKEISTSCVGVGPMASRSLEHFWIILKLLSYDCVLWIIGLGRGH